MIAIDECDGIYMSECVHVHWNPKSCAVNLSCRMGDACGPFHAKVMMQEPRASSVWHWHYWSNGHLNSRICPFADLFSSVQRSKQGRECFQPAYRLEIDRTHVTPFCRGSIKYSRLRHITSACRTNLEPIGHDARRLSFIVLRDQSAGM